MEVTTSDTELFKYTEQKLTAHYQSNDELMMEIWSVFNYFKKKLLPTINESDKERVGKELYTSIKSQIFNGYFMGCELLRENEYPDDFFAQSKGAIAQQIPDLLRQASNDNIEGIITSANLQNLISELVIKYENIYELLLDVSMNTACIGTKWAFLDTAEKRNIPFYQPKYEGLLTKLDEITFINPQTYISCNFSTDSSEVWEIIMSKHKGQEKIGEVIIIVSHQNEDANNNYYMNISLRNTLTLSDQQIIIDQLGSNLLANQKIERKFLILNASSVEEYYFINNHI